MNPIKSVRARFFRYKADFFDNTPDGKKLKRLKNIHSKQRCFIIGNGPSLLPSDLERLSDNREITFAFNRIYHIFEQTKWRPTYYVSQDGKMLAGCIDEVQQVPAKIKFIPAELDWYEGIHIDGAQLFHIVNLESAPNLPEFSENIAKYICNSKTVVYTAIQIAIYMGINEIYLLGVDHHFHTSINSNGDIVIDPTAKDYFSEQYNRDKEHLYIPNTDISTLSFIAAKRYADTHGIKIYNATRGGKLEVFRRVNFDSLF